MTTEERMLEIKGKMDELALELGVEKSASYAKGFEDGKASIASAGDKVYSQVEMDAAVSKASADKSSEMAEKFKAFIAEEDADEKAFIEGLSPVVEVPASEPPVVEAPSEPAPVEPVPAEAPSIDPEVSGS